MELSLHQIISFLNSKYPPQYQESWDNSGLLIDTNSPIKKALTCLDCTIEVVNEAIEENATLIIAHHPLIFSGLKRIVDSDKTGQIVKKIIQNNIAFYCAHTNFDSAAEGLNYHLAQKIGLIHTKVLEPLKSQLYKLTTYVPDKYAEKVRSALFSASAGDIGNYSSCSFNVNGTGTFLGQENTNPFVGTPGKLHFEPEIRIETIVEQRNVHKAIEEMKKAHPYEEVAYDLYPLHNELENVGLGRIGDLPYIMDEKTLATYLREKLNIETIACTKGLGREIGKVAIVGGSGTSAIGSAIRQGADALITGDIKHHTFVDHEKDLFLVDIGHYESEKIAMNIFYDNLTKKFPNFAVCISKANLNPINYL